MDELIQLIGQTYSPDEIGQMAAQETAMPVWARVRSVTRSEWADAGQRGMQPQLVATTPMVNYSGQRIVGIGSGDGMKRYAVYRTYFPPESDEIELYLEYQAGVGDPGGTAND